MPLIKELKDIVDSQKNNVVTDVNTGKNVVAYDDTKTNVVPEVIKPSNIYRTDVGTGVSKTSNTNATAITKANAIGNNPIAVTDVNGTKTVTTLGNQAFESNVKKPVMQDVISAAIDKIDSGDNKPTNNGNSDDNKNTDKASNSDTNDNSVIATLKKPTYTAEEVAEIIKPIYEAAESTQLTKPVYTASEQTALTAPTYTAPQQSTLTAPTYTAPQQSTLTAPTYTAPEQSAIEKPSFSDPGAYSGSMPTYSGTYTDQIAQVLQEVLGRTGLEYDQSKDPFYATNKQLYTNAGKQAMRDTIGQAAALTGGYASSYAQAVGQQQYNNYMQQLASMAPELYQMALSKYNSDTDNINNRLNALRTADDTEYGRYRDDVSDYWQQVDNQNWERQFAQSQYNTELNQYNADRTQQNYENETAYNQYRDSVSNYRADQAQQNYENETAYDQYRDSVSDYRADQAQQNYENETAYNQYRDSVSDYRADQAQQNYENETAYNQYRDAISDYYNDVTLQRDKENTDYSKYRDTVSDYYNDKQLQDSAVKFNYQKQQDAQTQQNYEDERDYERYMALINAESSTDSSESDIYDTEYYKTLKSYVQKNGFDTGAENMIQNLLNDGRITVSEAADIGASLGYTDGLYKPDAPKSVELLNSYDVIAQIAQAKKQAEEANIDFSDKDYIDKLYLTGKISRSTANELYNKFKIKYKDTDGDDYYVSYFLSNGAIG